MNFTIFGRFELKIKENDGLPQQVCMRCVGTLEFLCDFYERCQRTEKGLLEIKNQTTETDLHQKVDMETDKENVRPSIPVSSENNQSITKILKSEKKVIENEENANTIVRTTRSRSLNGVLNPMRKSTNKINSKINNSENPMPRRKIGRPRKRHLSDVVVKKEIRRDDGPLEDFNHRAKRQCLSAICTNSKSDRADSNAITRGPQKCLQYVAKEQPRLVGVSKDLLVESKGNDTKLFPKFDDLPKLEKDVEKREDDFKQTKSGMETEEDELPPIVWIPSKMLMLEPEKPKPQEEKGLPNPSPPPGDEAEKDKNSESVAIAVQSITDHCNPPTLEFPEQTPVTIIIESSLSDDAIVAELLKDDSMGVTDQSAWDASQNDERSNSGQSSQDGSFSGDKSKIGTFGKIAELISEEDKETIEKYYEVNMSTVNTELVMKNVTAVDKRKVKCNICGRIYLRLDKCQVHIWGHLKMKPYQCKACDFSTVTVSNVRCHIRKSHLKIKPFACHLCEKRYVTAVLLEEHLNTHTGARPFKCKHCDFASGSRQMLSYHKTTHKPVKDVNCKICGKQFYSRGRLRSHMFVHNKDRVVKCEVCSTYLSNAEALKTHHKNIHMREYVCNICGKHVKSRKALHNHINVHATAKFKCTLCPNVYKSRQILKEHLLKHEGIRKYKCKVCEKTFAQQSHLAAHMAVHSNIRFHCPGCDKAFNRHDNMKIHTKRCKPFLENPNLKYVVIKREKLTESEEERPASVQTVQNIKSSDSMSPNEIQNGDVTLKTVNDVQKTDTNQSDTIVPEMEGTTILETVLKPESF